MIHRFYGQFDFKERIINIKDQELVDQLHKVLRFRPGERIALFNGSGKEAICVIKLISAEEVVVEIQTISDSFKEGKKINLYLAVLKKENFELALQKAVECGITSITPIITRRTVKLGLNLDRLERIVKEAAEQSGRGMLPTINGIVDFEEAAKTARGGKIIGHMYGKPFQEIIGLKNEEISIFIGPEGGWETKEVEIARDNQIIPVDFGPRVMRAETAAIVSVFIASELM